MDVFGCLGEAWACPAHAAFACLDTWIGCWAWPTACKVPSLARLRAYAEIDCSQWACLAPCKGCAWVDKKCPCKRII